MPRQARPVITVFLGMCSPSSNEASMKLEFCALRLMPIYDTLFEPDLFES